jgi:hypothetical protein
MLPEDELPKSGAYRNHSIHNREYWPEADARAPYTYSAKNRQTYQYNKRSASIVKRVLSRENPRFGNGPQ